ncbi:MAG: LacI family transcriptional regulator [Planctomycetes bacterium]|nr:LacI family transcriptional regulator [Planctomycetota bacterium]
MKSSVPNLDDVAKQAGVSKSTVSRILNNRLGNGFSVKEEVRQRVLKIAMKLNYRPNLIAKSLTMRSTRMIHIFGGNHALSELGNIYQTVVNNLTQVIDSLFEGYDVTVDMSRHTNDISEMPAWKIDGAIILAKCSQLTIDEISQMGIPYVIINGACPKEGCSVVPNDVEGTRIAIRHLIDLGHSKIAYCGPLAPYLEGHSSLKDRYETYLSEMRKCGFEPVLGSHETQDSAENFLKEVVLARGSTAILSYGHMGALNLMQAAHTLDISVPDQLSLLCFCDEYANRVMSPGLTFIDLCSEKMGKIAAELLLDQIHNPNKTKARHIVLSEKLVMRNTTAPLARR